MRYYDNGDRKNAIVMKQIVIEGQILPDWQCIIYLRHLCKKVLYTLRVG